MLLHYMNQIYKMLKDKSEKQEYLHTLNSIKNNTKFESYKINFKRFENGL